MSICLANLVKVVHENRNMKVPSPVGFSRPVVLMKSLVGYMSSLWVLSSCELVKEMVCVTCAFSNQTLHALRLLVTTVVA